MQIMSTIQCTITGQTGTIIAFTPTGLATIDWDVAPGRQPAYSNRPIAQLLPFTPDAD